MLQAQGAKSTRLTQYKFVRPSLVRSCVPATAKAAPSIYLDLLLCGMCTNTAKSLVPPMAQVSGAVCKRSPNCCTISKTLILLGVIKGTASLLKLPHHTTDTVQCANLGLPSELRRTMRSNSQPLAGQ